MLRGVLLGVVLTLLAEAAVAYGLVATGHIPANADAKPGALESWAAHKSLRATIQREAPQGPNPVALSEQSLQAGLAVYQANCKVCHGGPDAKATSIAKGLYQPAPQLAKHGVEDDPEGATYWKIFHGIRLTGMPAFKASLSEEQLWQVTLFLKHMDALPDPVKAAWN